MVLGHGVQNRASMLGNGGLQVVSAGPRGLQEPEPRKACVRSFELWTTVWGLGF